MTVKSISLLVASIFALALVSTFGGHRVEAIRATDEAIHQPEECIHYDKTNLASPPISGRVGRSSR